MFPYQKLPNGCWNSIKKPSTNGYPYTRVKGRQITQARAVYADTHGEIAKGQVLRHRCDNKLCINPSHMMLGTPKDNSRDAMERGLAPRGTHHGMSKLSQHDARAIGILSGSGFSGAYLARLFRVNKSTISKIVRGIHWTQAGV